MVGNDDHFIARPLDPSVLHPGSQTSNWMSGSEVCWLLVIREQQTAVCGSKADLRDD